MLSVRHAQKLSPSINVELVDGQEVCGRYVDGITSQPHSGYPTVGYREALRAPLTTSSFHRVIYLKSNDGLASVRG